MYLLHLHWWRWCFWSKFFQKGRVHLACLRADILAYMQRCITGCATIRTTIQSPNTIGQGTVESHAKQVLEYYLELDRTHSIY